MQYRGYVIEVTETSYLIMGNNKRIFQENSAPFDFPFERGTVTESAQAHIDAIIDADQAQQQEAVTITQLQQQIADLQDALIELASAVEGGSV